MKVRATFKDPDTMPDACQEAAKRLAKPDGVTADEWVEIQESRAEEAQDAISDKWMEWSEYITVEFDTDAGTATVIPKSKAGV